MCDFLYKPANVKGSLEEKLADVDKKMEGKLAETDQKMEAKLADMEKSMEAKLLRMSTKMERLQKENKNLKRGLAEHELRLCDIGEELESEV